MPARAPSPPRPAPATPARVLRAAILLLAVGTLRAARMPHQTTQLKIVCQERVSQLCWSWPLDLKDIQLAERKLHRVPPQYLCGITDLTAPTNLMEILVSSPGNDATIPTCKRTIQLPMNSLNDWSFEKRKWSRQRRQVSYRGRFRGQTQSQYLTIDQGANKDEGKAEAISAADTSKAVVSGRSGMGQAQSQSIYDPSCDECVDHYVPGAESLRRPTGVNTGNGNSGPGGVGTHGGDSWNGPQGVTLENGNWRPGGPKGNWNDHAQGVVPGGPNIQGESNWNPRGGGPGGHPNVQGESNYNPQAGGPGGRPSVQGVSNYNPQGEGPGGRPNMQGESNYNPQGGGPGWRPNVQGESNYNPQGGGPGWRPNVQGESNYNPQGEGPGGRPSVQGESNYNPQGGGPGGRPNVQGVSNYNPQGGGPGGRPTVQGESYWNPQGGGPGGHPNVQGESNYNPQGGGPGGRPNVQGESHYNPQGAGPGRPNVQGESKYNPQGGGPGGRPTVQGESNWNPQGRPGENWAPDPAVRGPTSIGTAPSGIPGGGDRGEHVGRPGETGSPNIQNQPSGNIQRPGYWPQFLAKDWSVLTGAVPGVPQGSTYFCCVVGPSPPQYIGTSGGPGINAQTGPTIFNMEPKEQWNGQGGSPGTQGGGSGGQGSPSGGGWNTQAGGPGSQAGGPGTQGGRWNGQGNGLGSQGGGSNGQGGSPGSQGRWNGQGGGPGNQGGGWNGQGEGPDKQGGSNGQGGPSRGGWSGQGGGPDAHGGPGGHGGSAGGGWNGQGGGPGTQGGDLGGQGGSPGAGWNGQVGGMGTQGGPGGKGGPVGGGWNGQGGGPGAQRGGPGAQGGGSGGLGGGAGGGWNGQGGRPGTQGGGLGGQGGPSGGGWNGQVGGPGTQGGGLGGQGGPAGGGWNGQNGGPGTQGGGLGGQGGPSGGGWNGQTGGPGTQGGTGGQSGPQGGGWTGQGGGPSSQGGGLGGQGGPTGGEWNVQGGSPGTRGGLGGQGGPQEGGWNGQGGGPGTQGGSLGGQGGRPGGGWNGPIRGPGTQGGGLGGQGGPTGGGWNGPGGGPGTQGGGLGGQGGPTGGGWNGPGGGPGTQGGGLGGQGGPTGGGWNGPGGGPGTQGGGLGGQGGPTGGGWNGPGGGPGTQGGGLGGQVGPTGGGWNGPGGGPNTQGGGLGGQGGPTGGGWNGPGGGPGTQGGGLGGQGGPTGGGWNGQGGGPGTQGGSSGQGIPPGGGWNGQGSAPDGQGGNQQIIPGNIGHLAPPQNVIDPNSIAAGGDDSQAESTITQNTNGTMATASSNGGNDKGRAKTQVSGTYAGSGTFSAQAEISDETKGAQSEVSGGKHGAISIAQGHSRNSKSQANVNLGSETGSLTSGAQSDGYMHSSNTQVQGGVKGGSAEAQARGPGSTSSQAQIGFTPFKDSDKAQHDELKTPFVGAGKASSHSNGRMGESQSQLEGTFKYGIKYTGAAQSGSSLDKDAVFASRLPFNKIDVFDKSDININVDDTETPPEVTPLSLPDINDVQNNVVNITEKPPNNSGDGLSDHTHLDHHMPGNEFKATPVSPPPAGNTRSFQPTYASNNADLDYTSDKEDNPADDYDGDGGFGPDGDTVEGEYNYEDFGKETETHQSLHTPSRKSFEIKQSTGGNTQHIVLGGLRGQDAVITQRNTHHKPDESRIYQPGESVPGTGGYIIPIGFTGSVKSVASKQNTYAIGTRRSPSQAQTVSLTPGSGRVKYVYPNVTPYGKYVPPKDLRSYSNNNKDDSNRYISVSKTVTGALDNENNIRKQYSHTYYTKSSSCGYFTFTCTMVSGPDGRKKVCKPKIPANPDGTPMRC